MRGDIISIAIILGVAALLMVGQGLLVLRMISSPKERINRVADMLSLDNVLSPQQALHIYLNYKDNDNVLRLVVAGAAFAAARKNPITLAILTHNVPQIERLYSKKFLRKVEALKIGSAPAEIPGTDLDLLRSYCQMWESGSIGGISGGTSYDQDLYYNTFLGDVPLTISPITISKVLYRNRAALERFVSPDSSTIVCANCWTYYQNLRNGADPEEAYAQAVSTGCADACKNLCTRYLTWLSDLNNARVGLQYNYGVLESCILCYVDPQTSDCGNGCKLYSVLTENPFSQ